MYFYVVVLIGALMPSFSYGGDVRVVLKVKFKTAAVDIQPSQAYVIDNLSKVIEEFPEARAYVVGHTDAVGSQSSNQRLSDDRANLIHDIILKKGVDSIRVSAIGMGELAPIADNNTEEGKKINRRVVVVFVALDELREGELKKVIIGTKGLGILKGENSVVQAYIKKQERDFYLANIKTENKVDDGLLKANKIQSKADNKIPNLLLEINSLHSELESKDKVGNTHFNEILSEVRMSFRTQYFKPLKENLSLGFELGAKIYEFSTDLSDRVAEDQTEVGFSFGVGLKHKTLAWMRNELWLNWNQQLYFKNNSTVSPSAWSFELADVFRLDWRPVFTIVNKSAYDFELGPIFSIFSASSDDTENGYSLGVEWVSHFLFSKKIGLGVRYQRAFFDYEDGGSTLQLNNENLEIGFNYKTYL